MDWIHCNQCFIQPGSSSNQKFILTSCGHIFCERCNSSACSSSCRVCDAQYTTTMLSSQLREDVREFFISDPTMILNRYMKVVQFQKEHRDRFIAHQRRAQTKYEAAKKEILRIHEEMKQMRKKMHSVQQELAWYKMQRDRARARATSASSSGPSRATADGSPFGDTQGVSQRSQHQQMQGSGMGDSRLTMGFTGATGPRSSQGSHGSVSPFSMPSTPAHSMPRYRTNRTFMSTPESSLSGHHSVSFMSPPETPSTGARGFGHQPRMPPIEDQSPPTRGGTPTDALKLLSLAFKKTNSARQ